MNELAKAVQTLRSAVDDLEPKLEGSGLSMAALEDFKATVDAVRTSVLATLTGDNAADPRANLHKFRLRRGQQICRQVLSGLADGTIPHDSPELETLDSTVGEVLDRLKQF